MNVRATTFPLKLLKGTWFPSAYLMVNSGAGRGAGGISARRAKVHAMTAAATRIENIQITPYF
jgi:hypothetical protein